MTTLNESTLEELTMTWLGELGYSVAHGGGFAPGEAGSERSAWDQVVLLGRLRAAIERINPALAPAAVDEAMRKLLLADAPTLTANNRAFHRRLVDGVVVEQPAGDGSIQHLHVRVVDFDQPARNDWLAVNQFTVVENGHNRRPDILIFLNGLPVAVIELKNPVDAKTDIWLAFGQLQTYKQQIPALFTPNELLVISDGLTARVGSLTASKEWFQPWRTIEGSEQAPAAQLQLQVLVRGLLQPQRLLAFLRHFIVFEEGAGGALTKKLAGYHQFHAVNEAVAQTLRARAGAPHDGPRSVREGPGVYATGAAADPARTDTARNGGPARNAEPARSGDRRIGVVWHTQGSGKSLTMAFYAGRIVAEPAMENPTLVVLTDRNDLDDQLFATFARCHELLRQPPQQATDRAHLRRLLQVASGGVVFTTVHKFVPDSAGDALPMLSARSNIVVIADEAHRSQYDFLDGFARNIHDALPNASFIGFTGTPVELTDKNTRAVFGNYISIYDIKQAVYDGATVPIYYEARTAKLALDAAFRPHIDPGFEEITEGEEADAKEKLKSKWAALEALVGAQPRVDLIAADLIAHLELRQSALQGKAMVVCMSRRICVALYNALIKLRPHWHADDDKQGALKIVMTGSASDPQEWQPHVRTKAGREALALRFKNPADPLQIVIVRDMWLTGFDAPCLHTMYLDKPMQGHGLMQAIARVNRVFKDKPGGLVVDYLGLAEQLQAALATYTQAGGSGESAIDQAQAVAAFRTHYDICKNLFYGFDWSAWKGGSGAQKLALLPGAQEHILALDDGKKRYIAAVGNLSKAFALAVPHEDVLAVRDDVAFFQAVRAALVKGDGDGDAAADAGALDHAIQQLVSQAISGNEVVDIFAEAGLRKPDIGILSDEFMEWVRQMPQRNLAVELLRKLLNNEIRTAGRTNLVQARRFSAMLEQSLRAYENRAVETTVIIEEMLKLGTEIRAAAARGERLGLSAEEVAFYDALETNDSAVQAMSDELLKSIARDLVAAVRKNASIDWTRRDNVRAKMRVLVKRILRDRGYPPDKCDQATQTVLEQAELLSENWALA